MKKILLIYLACILFVSCKKSGDTGSPIPPIDVLNEDVLTFEEDSVLASLPDTIFRPSELFFPDGESFEHYAKNNDSSIVSNWGNTPVGIKSTDPFKAFNEILASKGSYYTNILNFDKPDEGTDMPAQNGLAYVLSGKNDMCEYDKRFKNGNCPNFLYGFECNGFVSRLFMDAGIMAHRYGTSELADPTTYDQLFAKSTAFKDLKYQYKGKIPINEMEAGDIIYFKHADGKIFHVGIVTRTNDVTSPYSPIFIYQSNGQPALGVPKKDKDGNIMKDSNGEIIWVKKGCERNFRQDDRGPRCVQLYRFVNTRINKGKDANGNIIYDYLFADYYVLKLISNKIVVTTNVPSLITQTTAVSGGSISGDDGNPITAKGICYSTTSNPTITTGTVVPGGNGSAPFTCNLTGLQQGIVYYVRAYATNSAGTAYGDEVSFNTSSAANSIYGSGTRNQDIECGDVPPPFPQAFCIDYIYKCDVKLQTVNKTATGLSDFGYGMVWVSTGTANDTSINLHCVRIDDIGHSTDIVDLTGSNTGVIQNGQPIFEGTYSRKWTSDADGSILSHAKGHFKMNMTF